VRIVPWTPFSKPLCLQKLQGEFRKLVFVGASPTRGSILRLEPEQREGFKRRMSFIGSAKEDFYALGSKLWMAGQRMVIMM
jgi:hypothetical protein